MHQRRPGSATPSLLLALALAAALPACHGPGPLSPREQQDLAAARALWRRAGLTAYTVETRTFCFCPVELSNWTRLTVRDGGIIGVEAVDTAFPILPATSPGTWRTVDQLFLWLEELARDPGYVSDVSVAYDRTFGYPTEILSRCDQVADCGAQIYLRNLSPGLPPTTGTSPQAPAGAGTRTRP